MGKERMPREGGREGETTDLGWCFITLGNLHFSFFFNFDLLDSDVGFGISI